MKTSGRLYELYKTLFVDFTLVEVLVGLFAFMLSCLGVVWVGVECCYRALVGCGPSPPLLTLHGRLVSSFSVPLDAYHLGLRRVVEDFNSLVVYVVAYNQGLLGLIMLPGVMATLYPITSRLEYSLVPLLYRCGFSPESLVLRYTILALLVSLVLASLVSLAVVASLALVYGFGRFILVVSAATMLTWVTCSAVLLTVHNVTLRLDLAIAITLLYALARLLTPSTSYMLAVIAPAVASIAASLAVPYVAYKLRVVRL